MPHFIFMDTCLTLDNIVKSSVKITADGCERVHYYGCVPFDGAQNPSGEIKKEKYSLLPACFVYSTSMGTVIQYDLV